MDPRRSLGWAGILYLAVAALALAEVDGAAVAFVPGGAPTAFVLAFGAAIAGSWLSGRAWERSTGGWRWASGAFLAVGLVACTLLGLIGLVAFALSGLGPA